MLEDHYCTRCEKYLKPGRVVWLELSTTDGQYYKPTKFPEEHLSQGAFAFGVRCAEQELER